MDQVESQLATTGQTDPSKAPTFQADLAKWVTGILTVFFGTLYQRSLKAKQDVKTSTDKDEKTTPPAKPADPSSSGVSSGEPLR